MASAALNNVLIVGATGNIGRAITEGFLADKRFNVFVLTHKGAQEVRGGSCFFPHSIGPF